MKYTVMKMDKRFTHHDLFEYCVKFSESMSHAQGPLQFNDALKWFVDTYGWSAEMRQYAKILGWVNTSAKLKFPQSAGMAMAAQAFARNYSTSGILLETPDCCNPYWSWTNGYDDLRIYVKSSAELNFFQLRWPNESK